ncbi:MAG TPA: PepSY domain-containing protein [Gammaproteobacteria bacterium]|nr:PepSY domain-containing protein [Gammaproteobacteria bacterium]
MNIRKCIQITLLSSLLALPAAAFAAPAASNNDVPVTVGSPVMKEPAVDMVTLISRLHDKGYNYIKEIEYGSNGMYRVKTVDSTGKKVELTLDPANLTIPVQEKSVKLLGTGEIAKAVMDAGYVKIVKIKYKGDGYEVKAYDKDDKAVRLEVSVTGAISKDWF